MISYCKFTTECASERSYENRPVGLGLSDEVAKFSRRRCAIEIQCTSPTRLNSTVEHLQSVETGEAIDIVHTALLQKKKFYADDAVCSLLTRLAASCVALIAYSLLFAVLVPMYIDLCLFFPPTRVAAVLARSPRPPKKTGIFAPHCHITLPYIYG